MTMKSTATNQTTGQAGSGASDFVRYLAAKKSVDDRALNRHVWQALAQHVAHGAAQHTTPLQVLEIGCGIGTMVERALEWGLFEGARQGVAYTAIDAEAGNVVAARERLAALPPWLELRLEQADVFDFVQPGDAVGRYDLLIAHAFLDLVDVPRILPLLTQVTRPGGLLYMTINFDGATILQPEIDRAFDDAVEAAYHHTMDTRMTAGHPSGDSRTGRHLFAHLAHAGIRLLAAGSSDWVVHAIDGRYPGDERFFLDFIVHTMHGALRSAPDIDPARFDAWIAARHAQIERGELVYIAHQLDFLGATPAADFAAPAV
jgi:2-polyprenyl-3-methyl-5-hydroxy-6-metoxy-1,4-benzoquinol methylase